MPGRARLVDQRGQVGERRLRPLGRRRRAGSSRSTPMTSRRSCSAWWALARITPAAARDLLGRRVGAELQRARVQAQQRDPVGEHVVHLAGDARALVLARLLDAQLLLGLGALGALAQRQHELAPRAHEHPPGDDGDRDEQDESTRPRAARSASGWTSEVDRQRRRAERRRRAATVENAPVDGDGEERDQARGAPTNAENAPIGGDDERDVRPASAAATTAGMHATSAGDEVGEQQRRRRVVDLRRGPDQDAPSSSANTKNACRRSSRAVSASAVGAASGILGRDERPRAAITDKRRVRRGRPDTRPVERRIDLGRPEGSDGR